MAIQAVNMGASAAQNPTRGDSNQALQLLESSRQGGVLVPRLLAQEIMGRSELERNQLLNEIMPQLSEVDRDSLRQEIKTLIGNVCTVPEKTISTDTQGKNYSISVEGSMENSLLASGCLYLKEDGQIVDSIPVTAGGFGSGAPQNGEYTVEGYRNRRPGHEYNKGMNREGVGFSFNLNPTFDTLRSLLRIHPDGNSRGTLGCIGLESGQTDLLEFESNMKNVLETHDSIPASIQIEGNPNHSRPPAKPHKVQE